MRDPETKALKVGQFRSKLMLLQPVFAQALVDAEPLASRNREMERGYKSGTVEVDAFCEFYIGTLCLMDPQAWQPWREQFLQQCIVPRLAPAGQQQIREHQRAGHRVVITTATNRFITELTAQHLRIEHLIATECELREGVFSGRTRGVLNMRAGKVERLHAWLGERGQAFGAFAHTTAYSDSINDLPLLQAVHEPVAVDPDAKLLAHAQQQGWRTISLR